MPPTLRAQRPVEGPEDTSCPWTTMRYALTGVIPLGLINTPPPEVKNCWPKPPSSLTYHSPISVRTPEGTDVGGVIL